MDAEHVLAVTHDPALLSGPGFPGLGCDRKSIVHGIDQIRLQADWRHHTGHTFIVSLAAGGLLSWLESGPLVWSSSGNPGRTYGGNSLGMATGKNCSAMTSIDLHNDLIVL